MVSQTSPLFDLGGIPNELKELPAWLAWYWGWDHAKKKRTKRPRTIVRDPESGKHSYSSHRCLRPLVEVLDFLKTRPSWGVGFSFHYEQPWTIVGIDLDSSRNPQTGQLTSFAREIVETINSSFQVLLYYHKSFPAKDFGQSSLVTRSWFLNMRINGNDPIAYTHPCMVCLAYSRNLL